MEKLTKTQKELVENMKTDIDYARSTEFRMWVYKSKLGHSNYNAAITYENCLEKLDSIEWLKVRYEEIKKGLVTTWTSTNTLKALERKGYIEILKIDDFDRVTLLNY